MSSPSPSPESYAYETQGETQSTQSNTPLEATGMQLDFQRPSGDLSQPLNPRHTHHSYEHPDRAAHTSDLPFVNNPGITIPEVTFVEPRSGVPGSTVTVYLRSRQPIELNPGPRPNLIFAGHQLPSQLWNNTLINGYYTYTLTALIPMISAATSPAICPLYLNLNDATQINIGPISIGNFEYWQVTEYPTFAPLQQDPSRKRRATSTSAGQDPASIKRAVSQTFPDTSEDSSFPYTQSLTYPMMPAVFGQQLPFVSQPQQGYGETSHGSFYHDTQEQVAYQTTHLSHFAPNHSQPSSQSTASTAAMVPSRQFGPVDNSRARKDSPENTVNIRTSILRRPNSRPKLKTQLSASQFNPYSIPKATLEIEGDLKSVLDNWTSEERHSCRRIVEFERNQAGSVITATFRVVSLDEWDHQKISVNCIWWKERKEAFITSVDLISLLESIMALRFTLQEKNRIRRNLEGFKPLTIGKSKADKEPFSEDVEAFFKVIMGLGEPRPRSIEKDVKVFPWNNLASAMKKVVDKYSASYASTAGMMDQATRSRNYPASPLRASASQSDSTSSPARSVAQSGDVDSRRESPYSAGLGPKPTLEAAQSDFQEADQPFAGASEEDWPATEGEDPAYLYTTGASDSYQLPDFASGSRDNMAALPSHLRNRDHTGLARDSFGRDAANYRPRQDN